MSGFRIKSNELNSETREQIKNILKNDDWVDALIILYKWILKYDPHLVIREYMGRAVGIYSPYDGRNIYGVGVDENGGLKTGSSMEMESLDFTFWDALEAVPYYRLHPEEEPRWKWYSRRYITQEEQD